ncbi:MAG: fluoride efflux transporter CrcB [Alphaproteobacteria bacterium]|nr:fluoride efflux transporter CrcB [Rhodobiaceae bacterium]MBO6542540.1 fluoride efflux transporter CrcB [Alphaproteobacteria bacterium]MBO6628288.1 fluoride efflux transporter CrcB [Alphaproteobacteria bacterium]MDF1624675.1 fluoride efflux transporter CrcB [Parvibaculaceae bacterium]
MKMLLAVALGGAVGASGRYLFAAQALRLMGPGFPWGTLGVNILGSFAMGVLVEMLALRFSVSPEMRVFLVTGLLGGFTTFSAFSLDVSLMIQKGELPLAALYVAGAVTGSILALFFGLWVSRMVFA